MLHLAAQTSPGWASWAIEHIDDVLLDHAHLEKKAAATAVNLLFRYPDHQALAIPLSRLAREELSHFELVLEHLQRRGVPYVRQKPSPYAGRLLEIVRTPEPDRLIDTLLCCALIEARSCERMQRLAEGLADPPSERLSVDDKLRVLYNGLLACEARHHATYVDLARQLGIVDRAELDARLAVIADHEAAVIHNAPFDPRLHNAAPPRS